MVAATTETASGEEGNSEDRCISHYYWKEDFNKCSLVRFKGDTEGMNDVKHAGK